MNIRAMFNKEFPFFMTVPAFLWQVLFFYMPLAVIIVVGFLQPGDTSFWQRFSLDQYRIVLSSAHIAVIVRSFILALINASLCVLLAYPVAYYLARKVHRWKNFLLFFLILPFWTNFLVQAYAWFFVLEKYGLINSLLLKVGIISEPLHLLNTYFSVYLVMLYCYFPFAVMPIYTIVEKLDTRMLEASYDLGATSWQTFYRVILPISSSGVITGFFLVFIASFGELVIPFLLGGGKQMYVGNLISHYFLVARNYNAGSAFTTISMMVLIIGALFFYSLIKRVFWNSQGIR